MTHKPVVLSAPRFIVNFVLASLESLVASTILLTRSSSRIQASSSQPPGGGIVVDFDLLRRA